MKMIDSGAVIRLFLNILAACKTALNQNFTMGFLKTLTRTPPNPLRKWKLR